MQRKTASRKLKRICHICNSNFKKGDIYYLQRNVMVYDGKVVGYEYLTCSKCKYKLDNSKERLEKFKTHCHHPIVDEVWSTIPGEYVMQPDHDECLICGECI